MIHTIIAILMLLLYVVTMFWIVKTKKNLIAAAPAAILIHQIIESVLWRIIQIIKHQQNTTDIMAVLIQTLYVVDALQAPIVICVLLLALYRLRKGKNHGTPGDVLESK